LKAITAPDAEGAEESSDPLIARHGVIGKQNLPPITRIAWAALNKKSAGRSACAPQK
jgi:hypothetical protein